MFYTTVIVNEYEVGLLYAEGKFVRTLGPGRYRLRPWRNERVQTVDLRLSSLPINGQEMLTADTITLRLNLAVSYRVVDAARAVNTVQNYVTALYTEAQLALRAIVTGTDLDTLMADRTALADGLRDRLRPVAETLGLALESVGVRDVILPGEVKKMLAREAEALRTGRAALVAAREETAAVRAALNTAKMLTDNPVLMQLRGLQSLEAVADKAGSTVVLALPGGLLNALNTK